MNVLTLNKHKNDAKIVFIVGVGHMFEHLNGTTVHMMLVEMTVLTTRGS